MSKRRDGGAAFPGTLPMTAPGMTLRQYYAGQALAGILANPNQCDFEATSTSPRYQLDEANDRAGIAERCYELADAMLAQKSQVTQ